MKRQLHWSTWTLNEWNSALLAAIFTATDELSVPITRINTTDRYLARLAEADLGDESPVMQRFIDLHRGSRSHIRRMFDSGVLSRWDPRADEPKFFTQLYLTLIVASATERTHSEGNFRKRLAMLLGVELDRDYIPSDLPRLWEAVETWSVEQAKRGRPVRPLILPDPGHETIVGYSKRLAFPSYRDEIRLSRVLKRDKLSVASPIEAILHGVGRSVGKFSRSFAEEYQLFRRAVETGQIQPTDTPFWGALEDITWSAETAPDGAERTKVRIELEVSSAELPSFEVLINDTKSTALPAGWCCEKLPAPVAGFSGYLSTDEELSGGMGEAVFGLHPVIHQLIKGTHTERAIREGCLCFIPGESVAWCDSTTLPDSGSAWIVMRHDLADLSKAVLRDHVSGLGYRDAMPGCSDWVLIGPIICGPSLDSVRWRRPFSELLVFQRAIHRPVLSLRDAIRMPDGVLFLRPMIPSVTANGADRVSYTIEGTDHKDTGDMEEAAKEPGTFVFSTDITHRARTPASLAFLAYNEGQLRQSRRVTIVGSCSSAAYREPTTDSWLVEGPLGQLTAIDKRFESCEVPSAVPNALAYEPRGVGHSIGYHRRVPSTAWYPLSSLPNDWADVLECLAGMLTNRRGLDFPTVLRLLKGGFALNGTPELVLGGLLGNCYLVRLHARRWRGQRFFARRPTVCFAKTGDPVEGRIIGLLPRLIRAKLLSVVREMGLRASIAVLGDWTQIGAICIDNADRQSLEEVAKRMGFDLLVDCGCGAEPYLEDPRAILMHVSSRVNVNISSEEPRYWSIADTAYCKHAAPRADGMVAHYPEKEQAIYVLQASGRPFWATQCREWAQMMTQWVFGGPLFDLDEQGTLTMPFAGPTTLGRSSILHGRGVCGTDWRSASHDWHYPFRCRSDALSFLRYWLKDCRTKMGVSISRWAGSMTNSSAPVAEQLAFRARYSR